MKSLFLTVTLFACACGAEPCDAIDAEPRVEAGAPGVAPTPARATPDPKLAAFAGFWSADGTVELRTAETRLAYEFQGSLRTIGVADGKLLMADEPCDLVLSTSDGVHARAQTLGRCTLDDRDAHVTWVFRKATLVRRGEQLASEVVYTKTTRYPSGEPGRVTFRVRATWTRANRPR